MKLHHSEVCDCQQVHPGAVTLVQSKMPPEDEVYEVAELFKVLGDTTRCRILCALSIHELCVCDLAEALQMTQSAISHQLRLLKAARIVKNRREGKSVFYSLDDSHIGALFTVAFEHVNEES